MLFPILLARQAKVDSTICIQRRYIQESPTLNTFDEVWTVAIPPIYQQMREPDTPPLEFIEEFQTQPQLRLEYIQLSAVSTMNCILFLYPLLGKVRTMIR
jgi:hypothetical protein